MLKACLYIVSTETFSGKSALCVGLGKRFQGDGFKIGYQKPISVVTKMVDKKLVDEDTIFMKNLFLLEEAHEVLSPVLLALPQITRVLDGEDFHFREKLF